MTGKELEVEFQSEKANAYPDSLSRMRNIHKALSGY